MTKEDKREKLEEEKARYRKQAQEGKKLTEQDEMELFKEPVSKEVAEYYMELNDGRDEMHPVEKRLRKVISKATNKMWDEIKRNQGRK